MSASTDEESLSSTFSSSRRESRSARSDSEYDYSMSSGAMERVEKTDRPVRGSSQSKFILRVNLPNHQFLKLQFTPESTIEDVLEVVCAKRQLEKDDLKVIMGSEHTRTPNSRYLSMDVKLKTLRTAEILVVEKESERKLQKEVAKILKKKKAKFPVTAKGETDSAVDLVVESSGVKVLDKKGKQLLAQKWTKDVRVFHKQTGMHPRMFKLQFTPDKALILETDTAESRQLISAIVTAMRDNVVD